MTLVSAIATTALIFLALSIFTAGGFMILLEEGKRVAATAVGAVTAFLFLVSVSGFIGAVWVNFLANN